MGLRYLGGFISAAYNSLASNITSGVNTVQTQGIYTLPQQAQALPNQQWVTDPNFKNTTLLLQADGKVNGSQNNTFLDSSSNNFTITRNGNTTQGTFTPFSSGWSNFTSAASATVGFTNIQAPLVSATTSTFTAECWIYMTEAPVSTDGTPALIGLDASNTSTSYLGFGPNASRQLLLRWIDGAVKNATGGTVLALNTWYHIAVVANSNALAMYVNGVPETLTGTTTLTNRVVSTRVEFTLFLNSNSNYQFRGYASNIRVCNSAVYTAAFTPSTSALTTTSQGATNCRLLTAQSNRFVDNSTNNFTLTAVGTPSVQPFAPFAPQYQYQNSTATNITWSNYFNNTPAAAASSYLEIPYNTAFNLGTNNFTMEGWIFISAAPSQETYIFGNPGFNQAFYCTIDSIRRISFYLYPTGGGSPSVVSSNSFAVPTNTWTHVAIVRDGSTVRLYINGFQYFSSTASIFGAVNNVAVPLRIAGVNDSIGTPYNFVGSISNFRIVNGTCLYPSGTTFTPSSTPLTAIPNTILLTCQSSTFVDNSSYNFPITVNNVTSQTTNPIGYTFSASGGSGYFDGTGDYLSVPSNAALAFGTGDYTVEAWVYFTAINNTDLQIIFRSGGGGNNFYLHADGNQLSVGTGGVFISVQATTFFTNTWYHVAACRSAGTLRLFSNGVQLGSSVTDSTNWVSTGTAGIGSNETGIQLFSGYISSVRVVNGTAVYTTNFTPPTAPAASVAGTSLLANFTNAGIYDGTMDNVLETVGNAQVSTSVVKYGSGSIYFDGTGDYLTSYNNGDLFRLGTIYTVEMWFYTTSIAGGNAGLINFGTTISGNTGFNLYRSSAEIICNDGATGGTGPSSGVGSVAANVWTHLAIVSNGTTTKVYLDGVERGSYTGTTGSANATTYVTIGAFNDKTANFAGYIDDLRITKGIARYTANFTPPKVALPRQ